MNRNYFVILIFVVSILSLISCSDSPSSIGSDLLSGDEIEVLLLDSYTDSLEQTSSYFREKISLGNSNRLFLGKKNNIEASVLLRFFYLLPDSFKQSILNDSITVIQAKVKLSKAYLFGSNDESLPLDYTVHKINSNWTITSFNEDSLSLLLYDASDLSNDRSFSDTLYSFNLDNNLALTWMEETADTAISGNKGIYLKPSSNSEKIVGFEAFTQSLSNFATLETIVQRLDGLVDTLYASLVGDVSVIKENFPIVSPENIVIQAGLASLGKLNFDLTRIPKNAVINHAQLVLTKDTTQSITGSTFKNSISAFLVKDSTGNELDSTLSVTLSSTGNTFSGLITSFVRRWQSGESNQGVLLVASGLLEGLELFTVHGSNAADFSKRPRLKITYTTIKR